MSGVSIHAVRKSAGSRCDNNLALLGHNMHRPRGPEPLGSSDFTSAIWSMLGSWQRWGCVDSQHWKLRMVRLHSHSTTRSSPSKTSKSCIFQPQGLRISATFQGIPQHGGGCLWDTLCGNNTRLSNWGSGPSSLLRQTVLSLQAQSQVRENVQPSESSAAMRYTSCLRAGSEDVVGMPSLAPAQWHSTGTWAVRFPTRRTYVPHILA